MSFIDELKRRNVLKTALLYVVSSWLVLQVADVLLPNLGAPDWAFRLVLGLLLLGFPIVLLFSWVFELTPEGLRREAREGRGSIQGGEHTRRTNLLIIVLLVLAIAAVVGDRLVPEPGPEASSSVAATSPPAQDAAADEPGSGSDQRERSLAVLPFADMSAAQDQAYLSDGIAEELLNLLARMRDLRVISRTSAFAFKDRDIQVSELAGQLGVAHVLEGSVRKSGDRVRITAQLIDAERDLLIWSGRWDRTLTDVFAIQDEIAQSVAEALRLTLLGDAPHVETTDPEAYTRYLRAQHLAATGDPDSMVEADRIYREVLESDPEFVPAWVGLGINTANMQSVKILGPRQARVELLESAQRVLQIDPDSPDGHLLMAFAEEYGEGDYTEAVRHYRRALELDPNNVRAHNALAVLYRTVGQVERAIDMQKRLLANDPLNTPVYFNLGMSYVAAGELETASTTFDRAISISPDSVLPRVWRALIDLLTGDPQSTLSRMEQLARDTESELFALIGRAHALPFLGDEAGGAQALSELESGYGGPFAYVISTVHATQQRPDEAFDWLQRALEYGGTAALSMIRTDPLLQSLHGDPRWQPFLEKAGLSDAQLAALKGSG